jgi:hypothetical protein
MGSVDRSMEEALYDGFLSAIAEGESKHSGDVLEGTGKRRRVAQSLIYFAHEQATEQFLIQVKSELKYIVDLKEDELKRLIDAFKGARTPFRVSQMVDDMHGKTRLPKGRIRSALDQMLNIGIFEQREGYPGQWRVGRLFKSSLGLLYARGEHSPS